MSKSHVLIAEPFRHGASHYSNAFPAEYMVVAQYNFPYDFNREKDEISSADSDRCFMWDNEWSNKAPIIGTRQYGYEANLQTASGDDLIRLCQHMLGCGYGCHEKDPEKRAAAKAEWMAKKFTGARVLCTVNRSNGYPVYSFEVFNNVTKVKTYSGESRAENIDPSFPPLPLYKRKPLSHYRKKLGMEPFMLKNGGFYSMDGKPWF